MAIPAELVVPGVVSDVVALVPEPVLVLNAVASRAGDEPSPDTSKAMMYAELLEAVRASAVAPPDARFGISHTSHATPGLAATAIVLSSDVPAGADPPRVALEKVGPKPPPLNPNPTRTTELPAVTPAPKVAAPL